MIETMFDFREIFNLDIQPEPTSSKDTVPDQTFSQIIRMRIRTIHPDPNRFPPCTIFWRAKDKTLFSWYSSYRRTRARWRRRRGSPPRQTGPGTGTRCRTCPPSYKGLLTVRVSLGAHPDPTLEKTGFGSYRRIKLVPDPTYSLIFFLQ